MNPRDNPNLGDNPKHFIYLTTWAETTLNMHLIASFLTCLYGYIYGEWLLRNTNYIIRIVTEADIWTS